MKYLKLFENSDTIKVSFSFQVYDYDYKPYMSVIAPNWYGDIRIKHIHMYEDIMFKIGAEKIEGRGGIWFDKIPEKVIDFFEMIKNKYKIAEIEGPPNFHVNVTFHTTSEVTVFLLLLERYLLEDNFDETDIDDFGEGEAMGFFNMKEKK